MVKIHHAIIIAISILVMLGFAVYSDMENSKLHALTQRIKSYNECIDRTSRTEVYEFCRTTMKE